MPMQIIWRKIGCIYIIQLYQTSVVTWTVHKHIKHYSVHPLMDFIPPYTFISNFFSCLSVEAAVRQMKKTCSCFICRQKSRSPRIITVSVNWKYDCFRFCCKIHNHMCFQLIFIACFPFPKLFIRFYMYIYRFCFLYNIAFKHTNLSP